MPSASTSSTPFPLSSSHRFLITVLSLIDAADKIKVQVADYEPASALVCAHPVRPPVCRDSESSSTGPIPVPFDAFRFVILDIRPCITQGQMG